MKKDQEPKTKDVYRLWWEYLKRSEKYRINCENDFKEPYEGYDKFDKYLTQAVKVANTKELKKKKKELIKDEWWHLYRTWETFGDVFRVSFEEWWKYEGSKLRKEVLDLSVPGASNKLTDFAVWTCRDCIIAEPGEDLAIKISEALTSDPYYVVVAIPITGNITMKEISQQISKIREKGKKLKMRRAHNIGIRYTEPIGRVRYDELKRYLQVYDMKQQNMSIREIIKKISPEKDDRDVYVQRQFYSDLKKAKTVIKNVEQGYFPSKKVPSEK